MTKLKTKISKNRIYFTKLRNSNYVKAEEKGQKATQLKDLNCETTETKIVTKLKQKLGKKKNLPYLVLKQIKKTFKHIPTLFLTNPLEKSFCKNNLTLWQPMTCTQGSIWELTMFIFQPHSPWCLLLIFLSLPMSVSFSRHGEVPPLRPFCRDSWLHRAQAARRTPPGSLRTWLGRGRGWLHLQQGFFELWLLYLNSNLTPYPPNNVRDCQAVNGIIVLCHLELFHLQIKVYCSTACSQNYYFVLPHFTDM